MEDQNEGDLMGKKKHKHKKHDNIPILDFLAHLAEMRAQFEVDDGGFDVNVLDAENFNEHEEAELQCVIHDILIAALTDELWVAKGTLKINDDINMEVALVGPQGDADGTTGFFPAFIFAPDLLDKIRPLMDGAVIEPIGDQSDQA
jgi:hypothetical protein